MTDEQSENFEKEESIYKAFLSDSKRESENNLSFSEDEQRKIINTGKNTARITNIMISLAVLLLIIPVMTLVTYMYYSLGGEANRLIEVAGKTIYVTEPNISLEEMEIEHDIGFFSMNIFFDVYKRIGKDTYKVGNYDIYFALDKPSFPKKNTLLERPLPEIPQVETEILLHPKANVPFNRDSEWEILKGLPNGTVAEVYVSLNKLMKPEDLKSILQTDTEIRWLAVDTGLEAKQVDSEGVPITPLGYPAQIDSTIWSPFNGREQNNEEVFKDILSLLEKNEDVAEKVARAKSLEIKERLAYIEENGIKVYGAVITGPTSELRKLEQISEIRAMKVGEVKLWNWK
ncbi:anti-sigma factor [Mesobacillus foraminis]|uniref:anti-sigma factor n=1 Tax=Mesobacillus foraminis TaxID=279826 RepID=UPI000EF4C44E|nr:anti-sigma factor [Mesobacillus foraminis]